MNKLFEVITWSHSHFIINYIFGYLEVKIILNLAMSEKKQEKLQRIKLEQWIGTRKRYRLKINGMETSENYIEIHYYAR